MECGDGADIVGSETPPRRKHLFLNSKEGILSYFLQILHIERAEAGMEPGKSLQYKILYCGKASQGTGEAGDSFESTPERLQDFGV